MCPKSDQTYFRCTAEQILLPGPAKANPREVQNSDLNPLAKRFCSAAKYAGCLYMASIAAFKLSQPFQFLFMFIPLFSKPARNDSALRSFFIFDEEKKKRSQVRQNGTGKCTCPLNAQMV